MASDLELSESNNSMKDAYKIVKKKKPAWKPAKFQSYETMGLTTTEENDSVRPCGFQLDNKPRKIKGTCLIARMKELCVIKNTLPKMAICITMYNEDESEFMMTMRGII